MKLTEAARPVLKGEQRVELRRHRPSKSATAKARREGRPRGGEGLSDADAFLFEALRDWRAATAKAQEVPAYVILHDRSLREIAEVRPASRGMLMDISGMGQAKVERYGGEILELVAACQR